jgi:hypothetical protein
VGRKSNVSEDIKAAVIADLAAGEQPAIVAERYGIDAGKVRMWKTRYVASNVADDTPYVASDETQHVVRRPSIEERHARLAERIYDLLEVKLEASRAISEHIKKGDWLDKQSGSDVADLGTYLDTTASTMLAGLATAAQRRALADQQTEDPTG